MPLRSIADCIREGLKRFRGKRLVQMDRYRREFSFVGGTWGSHAEGCRFTIGSGSNWTFRLNSGAVRKMYVWDAGLHFDGPCGVNVCITRWLEKIEHPGPTRSFRSETAAAYRWRSAIARWLKEFTLLPSSRNDAPAAYCSHVTVERISYISPFCSRIEGLLESDIEDIRALIEKPLRDLLARSVKEVQVDAEYWQELAVPVVVGELHWNWRNPMAELLAVHDTILDFVNNFTPERAASRPLSRYKIETSNRDYWSYTVTVDDEPDVRIQIPSVNREDPNIYEVSVRIAGMSFPVRIERLTPVPLEGMPLCPEGRFQYLEYYLLFHACSARFAAFPKSPPSLTPEIGDRAAEHLKSAWLAVNLEKMRKFGKFVDVLII
ncbi:hypothetical protein [Mesorhizobium sp. B2-3-12]|uniref:hypothetical protein n=1 Tax=Mesorhizobium sp. B2-3-12 TaxID=2589952 RepID=UPI0011270995|nr:hypothetical protein [Mesorhizobium sp. B2-3-12]TPL92474.1 hypothetical protein FJ948_12020 [Mesorhizobium sp. B2-3-12]